jgi:RNA polymerase sigma factor (sigma-70 family)
MGQMAFTARAAPGRSLNSRTDAALLSRCAHGDAAAWDTLVARYERLVFSVALRNGLSREDAAEVMQTTFIALLQSIDKLREEDRLSYWLMTVARRQAWRLRGRQDRQQPWTDELNGGGEEPMRDWERVAVLHDGLAQLGTPCNDLLFALYFDPASPSYAQIATRLGRAIGGLGPLRARCLEKLRSILGEEFRYEV